MENNRWMVLITTFHHHAAGQSLDIEVISATFM
jgi:hypothetical protein